MNTKINKLRKALLWVSDGRVTMMLGVIGILITTALWQLGISLRLEDLWK